MSGKALKPLTKMQEAFVAAYMELGEQTKAANVAGFKHPQQAGALLMSKPHIVAEIDRRRKRLEQRVVKPGEVVKQTVNIMRGNIADVMDWGFTEIEVQKPDGSTAKIPQPWVRAIPRDELPREVTDAIAEVQLTDKGAFKIKMHDKGAAIDKLMKHLGLYEADNRQHTDALAKLIAEVQGARMPVKRASDDAHASKEPSEVDE
ncbi:terminase small subunit [Paracoccus alkanivorans]|uniref:Terminase small subunit n=1 Tax=Paracoccus alkanivorans TaxID=2116655 RepID=A0A3M0M8C1_9RHOB|nr:terminase small subunit [Paracoccus alkanivorans]RMC33751.1 hypothetical protein C9E81_15730 [Paracoccus alkanivorans]